MIISYDFGIDVKEYSKRGKENGFPIIDICPKCQCNSYGNFIP